MALLERVTTLLRANVNDLLSKAEDPEKLGRQLLLDIENQLLQVKTQVAIAIADQHLLMKKRSEQEAANAQWLRKAELAVSKAQDELARAALERALSHQRMRDAFAEQYEDQTAEADSLRAAYSSLQGKLNETKARLDLLITQARRNRALQKADAVGLLSRSAKSEARLRELSAKVEDGASRNHAARTMLAVASSETLDERFEALERNDQIEALLLELKERQPRLDTHS
ncbi:MAG TPA: PspA/IM30 family protein [Acidobacteriaceae bacterium]|nr:PspA/IM30 family protein [Acidobacteriaceae bacterium]